MSECVRRRARSGGGVLRLHSLRDGLARAPGRWPAFFGGRLVPDASLIPLVPSRGSAGCRDVQLRELEEARKTGPDCATSVTLHALKQLGPLPGPCKTAWTDVPDYHSDPTRNSACPRYACRRPPPCRNPRLKLPLPTLAVCGLESPQRFLKRSSASR